MRTLLSILMIVITTGFAQAQIPDKYRGDWLLVNGVVVLHIGEDGTMVLRNSGDKGKLAVQKDGSFSWTIPSHPQSGRFAEGKLFLKNDQEGAPKWMAYLEFRRTEIEVASEVIEFALRQQTQAANAYATIRRSSMEKAMLNNLRQLAAAADQYFLENGTNTVKLDQIVGPEKYIKKLSPVDGEDYGKLDLTQSVKSWKIVSESGITVSYDR